jgi:hypothetical protein
MMLALRIASLACGLLAFFGIRPAYVTYIVLSLLYFPLQVGFEFHPRACQMAISPDLALQSLTNWGHVVLFGIFYLMTMAQFRLRNASAFAWSACIVIVMGALVEIAEGTTGARNCRLRDLVPDAAGAALGFLVVRGVDAVRGR